MAQKSLILGVPSSKAIIQPGPQISAASKPKAAPLPEHNLHKSSDSQTTTGLQFFCSLSLGSAQHAKLIFFTISLLQDLLKPLGSSTVQITWVCSFLEQDCEVTLLVEPIVTEHIQMSQVAPAAQMKNICCEPLYLLFTTSSESEIGPT